MRYPLSVTSRHEECFTRCMASENDAISSLTEIQLSRSASETVMSPRIGCLNKSISMSSHSKTLLFYLRNLNPQKCDTPPECEVSRDHRNSKKKNSKKIILISHTQTQNKLFVHRHQPPNIQPCSFLKSLHHREKKITFDDGKPSKLGPKTTFKITTTTLPFNTVCHHNITECTPTVSPFIVVHSHNQSAHESCSFRK